MDLDELINLITVRQYVVNSTANPTLDRETVGYMSKLLLMIDKKIIDVLKSPNFKKYVDYENIQSVIKEVAKLNDIKSGIRNKL